MPIGDDADDIFFDADGKRIFVICGEGVINVIRQEDPNHYVHEATVPIEAGARTDLFVPQLHRLYVGVPQHVSHDAQIRVFAVAR
jgi:hypothetical protein